ncbi:MULTISPECIES: hypothetical protein [unclassified Crossiella]|uniref:hypothetical protein n=1 Tax=unclassified Crossiella TaxID=2620835 RepID=UPI001FFFBDA5|nr:MULTISPECIES: hypothetical protein [unclassified Crossiella]MCK2240124.1 hypothetical protein [Crossiella sp. S99.2]MCK2253424.1 hypothetical protein [Crossiella sp. S99.1]
MGTRDKQALARISRTLAAGERPDGWQDNRISYAENLRAEMEILDKTAGAYWHTLGCTPAEARLVEPLALHFHSLVFQGERGYAAARAEGSSRITDHSWKTRLQDLLKNHNVYDSRIQATLDDLERYHVLEGQVLLGELPLTEAVLEEIAFLRSSDLHVLVRVIDRLKGRTPDEEFYQLVKTSMALFDLDQDLGSHQRGSAGDSHKTLRLYRRLHGADQAGRRLRELRNRIAAKGLAQFAKAGKPALVRYLTSTPLVNLNLPVLPALLGLLPRPVLVTAATSVFKFEGFGAQENSKPIAQPIAELDQRKEDRALSS